MLDPTHYSLPGLYWLVSSQYYFHNFYGKQNSRASSRFLKEFVVVFLSFFVKKRVTNISYFLFKKGFYTFKLINLIT